MNNKAGLYIHIPFCMNKCPYCDFFSVKYDNSLAEKYVDKVIKEFKNYKGSFDTIYFGGGTPSAIEPELIGKIIKNAKSHFDIASDCEVTVECNPSKNLERDFYLYSTYGVNRISIGMQSAVDKERWALGRKAGKTEVEKAINIAKANGIDNISLDLMIGTPKQTINSLNETFDFIKQMNVKHISAYMLKIEYGTKFYQMKDKLALPTEDTVCDMYLKVVSYLNSIGLKQYEISNFAKTGFESRHNTKYWTLDDYLGIGSSAHSFWHGKRFYYDKNFNIINDGNGGNLEEQIMLGLRLNKGISKKIVNKDYTPYIKAGLMDENDENIFLTPQGMLVSNTIISDLI